MGNHVDPPKWTFVETTFRPLEGAASQIFTPARDWPRLASTHPKRGQGPKNFIGEQLRV